MNITEIVEQAKKGNSLIEEAIINLLKLYPNGLSNTEIATKLNLQSSHEGGQSNYLTFSVLGNLMERDLLQKRNLVQEVLSSF